MISPRPCAVSVKLSSGQSLDVASDPPPTLIDGFWRERVPVVAPMFKRRCCTECIDRRCIGIEDVKCRGTGQYTGR